MENWHRCVTRNIRGGGGEEERGKKVQVLYIYIYKKTIIENIIIILYINLDRVGTREFLSLSFERDKRFIVTILLFLREEEEEKKRKVCDQC